MLTVLLDVAQEKLLLLVKDISLSQALLLTFLNLVNDFAGTFASSNLALDLTILLCLDILKTFDLHHGVKSLLLVHPLLFENQVLSKLLIANGVHLGVHHQCVETLNVVLIFVELLLGFGKHGRATGSSSQLLGGTTFLTNAVGFLDLGSTGQTSRESCLANGLSV